MNINEILERNGLGDLTLDAPKIKEAIKEIVEKTLEMAAENAKCESIEGSNGWGIYSGEVDKKSITNTINQIKF